MQIGINWTSPKKLSIIKQLLAEKSADFCEVMVDNFAHLPAKTILAALSDTPIALHIVSSRFLEKSVSQLQALATTLRPWIKALQPIYVSDHLIKFCDPDGRYLPMLSELDYERDFIQTAKRVEEWQNLLDTPLFFENHASLTKAGRKQSYFFTRLLNETGAKLLFDFSNAYIAQHNQVCDVSEWETLVGQAKHFHVAGFHIDKKTRLAIDSHAQEIDAAVLTMIKAKSIKLKNSTLVIEFESDVTVEKWANEISKIRNLI